MARRRSSSDVEDGEGEDSYASQAKDRAKRPRYTNGDASESSGGPVLPNSFRTQPRETDDDNENEPPHQPGSVVRIKMTNFVTYTSSEFKCGSSLNMVIGPNGNGKSTLVCAICLGLGWSPQHLGRAKSVGEFVKNGTTEAAIEIELAGGPQTRGRNPSFFFLDGHPTPHKRITELCKSFSIQIDNLCQFLPQDRVVEFAALGPRAAAPEHMTQRHEQLKELRKTQEADQDKRQNAQKADQQLKDKLEAYKRIRPCVNYRVTMEKMHELVALKNEMESKKTYLEEVKKKTRAERSKQIENKEREIEAERGMEKEKTQEIRRIEANIKSLQRQMEEQPEPFDAAQFNERIREKARRMREIDAARELKNRQVQAEQEMESLNSQAGRQTQKLQRMSPDTARAWQWIQQNQNHVTCSVKDPAFADAGDFCAITCTDKRDFRRLSEKMAEMRIRDVHIREAVRPLSTWKSPLSQEVITDLGFSGWILDCLTGPEPVLSMLCDTVRLHQTPVARGPHSEQQFDRVIQSGIGKWVAGRVSYMVSRRKEYGDAATSTMTRRVNAARVWTDQAVDTGADQESRDKIREIRRELEEIANQLQEMRDERQANRGRHSELENEKRTIEHEKGERQKMHSSFAALPTKLGRLFAKMGARMLDLDIQIDHLALRKGQASIDYAQLVQKLLDCQAILYDWQIREAEAISECEVIQARNEEVNALVEERQREWQALDADWKRLKTAATGLKEQVARLVSTRTDEEVDLVAGVEQTISMEELEAEIESFGTRLTLLHGGDPNAIREYEKRARTIEEKQAKLGEMDEALEQLQEQIDAIKATWEPELDALVEQISAAFSYNFEQIGCAGQVSVHKADDFDQWAIQIQVKFREHESLSLLTSHRQSGGERAVSTIFYLMALQSLARSPFRVVDEINQGMDPRNERMVHERMVQIACREHTSQYFLITPKLLPGLNYHPWMRVHSIVVGEFIPEDYRRLDLEALADVAMAVKGRA
ncbi:P-loop containing nucleoside triphosphate hydrolase protein [Phyllosticta citrichinensis]|uniref:Structural maintenance of chromosomes protein 5 n=1 Tax=Phyllosticta citrichinensis TaxID=1130410 RepID=A0ABR1XSR0_9PEZI